MRWIWFLAVGGCAWISTDDFEQRRQDLCDTDPTQEGCEDIATPTPTAPPELIDCFSDGDGDGYGSGDAIAREACEADEVEDDTDCDDTSADVNPGAHEVCGNGIDEDCDGDDLTGTPGFIDADDDGFGDQASDSCSTTEALVDNDEDCDDGNGDIYPGAEEACGNGIDEDCSGADDPGVEVWPDSDADGFGDDQATPTFQCEAGANQATEGGDCDDAVTSIHPGADETCGDGIDQDCDGTDAPAVPRYLDGDGDGFGDEEADLEAVCADAPGYADVAGDCNDGDEAIHPEAIEICGNAIDENCDDNLGEQRWYTDADGDGYGDNNDAGELACGQPASTSAVQGDCDDNEPTRFEGAVEVFGSGIDEDCDLEHFCYLDDDGDGFGTGAPIPGSPFCDGPTEAAVDGDCDDSCTDCNPDADEICDGLDNDCDGDTDTDALEPPDWYVDGDGDGYGDDAIPPAASCTAPDPAGWVDQAGDCADGDPAINAGATEICLNGIDENCNGDADDAAGQAYYVDSDGDGQGFGPPEQYCQGEEPAGYVPNDTDCDDADGSIFLGSPNIVVGNAIDEDCDGTVECYEDIDQDGYGSDVVVDDSLVCTGNRSATTGDCADSNPDANPGETEVPGNNTDEDCSGLVACYQDIDGDGYGTDTLLQRSECGLADVAFTNGDCNDVLPTINPGMSEVSDNATDENCDGEWLCRDDGDGDGVPGASLAAFATACVPSAVDCNDGDSSIFPSAPELCDGLINDCNTNLLPPNELDRDNDGYRVCENDCNDTPATGFPVNPGISEIVANGIDDNCDGEQDCFADADGDTFGSDIVVSTPAATCIGTGRAANDADCDDTTDLRRPDMDEVCDHIDNDCDGLLPLVEQDPDNDGYMACDEVPHADLRGGDCGPFNEDRHPGHDEWCDAIDNDCSGPANEYNLIETVDGNGVRTPQDSFADALAVVDSDETIVVCARDDNASYSLDLYYPGFQGIEGVPLGAQRPLFRNDVGSRFIRNDNAFSLSGLDLRYGDIWVGDGACLYFEDGQLTLDDVEISGCFASGDGAAVYLSGGASADISNSTIESNYAGGLGGGVYCNSCDGLTVTNSTFYDNASDSAGGAILYEAGATDLDIVGSVFDLNVANTAGCVGVKDANALLDDVDFQSCSAAGNGGAMALQGSGSHVFLDVDFVANSADGYGQAFTVDDDAEVDMTGGSVGDHQTNFSAAVRLTSSAPSGFSFQPDSVDFYDNLTAISLRRDGTLNENGTNTWTNNVDDIETEDSGDFYEVGVDIAPGFLCDSNSCQ